MVTSESEEIQGIFETVLENVSAVPGVADVTLLENALISGWISSNRIEVDGEEVPIRMNAVGPGFFETFDIPIVAGRALDSRDGREPPWVAVLNETAAERYFGRSAVGRIFRLGGRDIEVVGVARDSRYASLREDVRPAFFDPFRQRRMRSMHVAVRWALPGPVPEAALRDAVARAHRGLPLMNLRTQSGQMRDAMSRETPFAQLLSLFAGVVLVLACIGLHGIAAFSVSRRTSEMGVRLALGARPQGVLHLVLRQVVFLSLTGVALGTVVAYLASPVVEALLYGVEPSDPATFGGAGVILLFVALAAGWLPARRAAGTDPMRVLFPE